MNEKILQIIKSGGITVIAGILVLGLLKILLNDMTHIQTYIEQGVGIMTELNENVKQNTQAIINLERSIK